MKKVTVFGGSGFIGSYVTDELSRRGYDVVIADKVASSFRKDDQKFIEVDILDIEQVHKAVEGSSIVFNFAGLANLDEAMDNPIDTIKLNVLGNLNILEACKRTGSVERFLYGSSAYSMSNEGSFYGISKYNSEKLTEEYYKRYGLKYTIVRYGSLYGERASHNNYIYNLLKSALETKQITYTGDDEDIREYIHAADAAKLSVNMIEDNQYENEHIILTGTEKLKRKELVLMINEIMQNQLEVKQANTNNSGHYKITPYTFHPSVAKKLTANPYIDLGQGLLECIQYISKELQAE